MEDLDREITERMTKLTQLNLSYDDLLFRLAGSERSEELLESAYDTLNQMCESYEVLFDQLRLAVDTYRDSNLQSTDELILLCNQIAGQALVKGAEHERVMRARKSANARHSKPGGSRAMKEQIRTIWASGKYSSRDICAEQECAALGISFSTARKALRNTPDPSDTT